jgi:hypothetical protein
MAEGPVCFQIGSFPLELRSDADGLEEQWLPLISSQSEPFRVFARTTRFDLSTPRQRLLADLRGLSAQLEQYAPVDAAVEAWDEQTAEERAAVLEGLPSTARRALDRVLPARRRGDRAAWRRALTLLARPAWRRRWLQEYARFYEVLTQQVDLRGVAHHWLSWLPKGVSAEQQVQSIQQALNTSVQPCALPALLDGDYEEQATHLAPQAPHLPLVAMLYAHRLTGTWTLRTLERLLDLDADVAVCIDVARPSQAQIELYTNHIQAATQHRLREGGPNDPTLRRKLEATYVFQEHADQGFFQVRLVVAVFGRNREQLENTVRLVQQATRPWMQLIRPPGGQGPLTEFWTTTREVSAVGPRRLEIGHGVAVMLPFGIHRPTHTRGIFWVLSGQTPILFDPLRDAAGRKIAGHGVIVGLPGNGKTTAAMAWSARIAAQGGQVIYIEPNEHAGRLASIAGPAGTYQRLDLNQRINILDVAVARDPQGRPPPVSAQNILVVTQLGVLLGTTGVDEKGQQAFRPRVFTSLEEALLDQALQRLYAPWADCLDELSPEEAPILGDLAEALRQLRVPEVAVPVRDQLHAELDLRLVSGSLGQTYNVRSTVGWSFTHDITGINLTALGEGTPRILYMFQLFAAINRYVRSRPDPDRPLYVFCDEFGATLRKVPGLAAFFLDSMKVSRTFLAAFWVMDQLFTTYQDDPTLRGIWEAASVHVYFAQALDAARQIAEAEDALHEGHAALIARQGLGECVVTWNPTAEAGGGATEVFVGKVLLSDAERRVLPERRLAVSG